jgi:hypothetical protein
MHYMSSQYDTGAQADASALNTQSWGVFAYDSVLAIGTKLYEHNGMTTAIQGNNKWRKSGVNSWRIGYDGIIAEKYVRP